MNDANWGGSPMASAKIVACGLLLSLGASGPCEPAEAPFYDECRVVVQEPERN